jgi:hypothetical protein
MGSTIKKGQKEKIKPPSKEMKESDNLEIKFKVDNKIDFITRDNIKNEFIEKITFQQQMIDMYEKDRFKKQLYEIA